ncbi:MAG: efflux RND transporter periplasmic adaptor subunit [Acidobacteriaceae bacterium]
MRKRSYLIAAAVLVVLLVVVVIVRSDGNKAATAEVPSASVALVARGALSHTLNLAGQFQPYQVVDVHAKVSGYIKNIYVDIGDKVHAGEVLAVLEVPELQAQLSGTVSAVAASKAEIARAQNAVSRAQAEHTALHQDYIRLVKAAAAQPGLIAQQELDDAQAKDLASESRIDEAKSALSTAEQQTDVAKANNQRVGALEDYTRVTAPLTGVIIWRYADTGALIQAGTSSDTTTLPVVKLSQSDLLRLRLPVPEDAVSYIHEGEEVNVRVDAVNRTFVGKVVRFTRNVSLATRTMETEIDVENKDLSLTPGMYANTVLQLEHRENVLTVPIQAVEHNGNQAYVLVVNPNNQVQQRNVIIGLQGSYIVEVKSGLNEGERVITGGQSNYQVGETVNPKVQQPPTADVSEEKSGDE